MKIAKEQQYYDQIAAIDRQISDNLQQVTYINNNIGELNRTRIDALAQLRDYMNGTVPKSTRNRLTKVEKAKQVKTTQKQLELAINLKRIDPSTPKLESLDVAAMIANASDSTIRKMPCWTKYQQEYDALDQAPPASDQIDGSWEGLDDDDDFE